jgi:hypothetical protein
MRKNKIASKITSLDLDTKKALPMVTLLENYSRALPMVTLLENYSRALPMVTLLILFSFTNLMATAWALLFAFNSSIILAM